MNDPGWFLAFGVLAPSRATVKGLLPVPLGLDFVPSISLKRPLKSIKIDGFAAGLPLVGAAGDWACCTCVGTEQRFRCTGVGRERF